MDLEQIRDTLLQAQEQQYASDQAALDMQGTLANQQVMYNNDARGTLYSGMPTWDRAQVAAAGVDAFGKLSSGFAQNKVNVWNTIQDTMDKINAMNEATSWYNGRSTGDAYSPTAPRTPEGATMDVDGVMHVFRDGRWVRQ